MAIKLFVSPNYKPAPIRKVTRMSTAARKAKGRRLQDYTRDILRKIGLFFGLVDDDIKSAIMGTSGVDIVFSPAAQQVFKLDVECKNVAKLNVVPTFWEHYNKYAKRDTVKILVHKKQAHLEPLVSLKATDFFELLRKALTSSAVPGQAIGEHDATT